MELRTTKTGLDLIRFFESLRLEAYDDGGGVMTIGWGHAIKDGEEFPKKIDEELAEILFLEDVKDAEEVIDRTVNVDLRWNQYDALVSFVYNLGGGNFTKSTLLKFLNQGNYEEVPKQFMRWVYDNGKKLKGLENRRRKEASLFQGREVHQ